MSAAAPPVPARPPLSPGRLALLVAAAAAILASLRLTHFNPALLLSPDSLKSMGAFAMGFVPPNLSREFLSTTLKPAVETVQLATAGVFLAFVLGFPLAMLAAGNLYLGGALFEGDPAPTRARRLLRALPYVLSRFVLNVMRSIPELVWALLFVRAVGLGPVPGILGIGVAYGGIVGKVYAEILESADVRPAIALRAAGASRPQVILYALLPQAFRTLLSYSLYRWECAMRAAVILGFVGAGGLGQQIEITMRMFEHHSAATLVIELFFLVAMSDVLSTFLRRRFG